MQINLGWFNLRSGVLPLFFAYGWFGQNEKKKAAKFLPRALQLQNGANSQEKQHCPLYWLLLKMQFQTFINSSLLVFRSFSFFKAVWNAQYIATDLNAKCRKRLFYRQCWMMLIDRFKNNKNLPPQFQSSVHLSEFSIYVKNDFSFEIYSRHL